MDACQSLTDSHSVTLYCSPLPSLIQSTVFLQQMSNSHLVLHDKKKRCFITILNSAWLILLKNLFCFYPLFCGHDIHLCPFAIFSFPFDSHQLSHPIFGLNSRPNSFPIIFGFSINNSTVTGAPFPPLA